MDYNEAIKNSRCFGIAYDNSTKECKVCEVSKLCKAKTEGTPAPAKAEPAAADTDTAAPDTEVVAAPRPQPKAASAAAPAEKPKAAPKPKKADDKKYAADMPDFKAMQVDELLKLAADRGIDTSAFDKYTEVKIKRMRIIMALKLTYEVK